MRFDFITFIITAIEKKECISKHNLIKSSFLEMCKFKILYSRRKCVF